MPRRTTDLRPDNLKVRQEARDGGQPGACRTIERCESPSMCGRQGKEIPVGELVGSLDVGKAGVQSAVGQRQIVRPEHVVFICDELAKSRSSLGYGQRSLRHRAIGEHSDAAHLGDRARGPAARPCLGEPDTRCPVMPMRWPEKRDQHVYIDQHHSRGHGKSARIRATSASSIVGKSAGVSNTSSPSSATLRPSCPMPLRARIDTASPSGTCRASARQRAASSTSSSIDSVVRMMQSYHLMRACLGRIISPSPHHGVAP